MKRIHERSANDWISKRILWQEHYVSPNDPNTPKLAAWLDCDSD